MGVTQVMWKEIAIGLIFLYIFRIALDFYIIKQYQKIVDQYGKVNVEIIKDKSLKHLKLCNIFSVGPWNKQIYLAYNGLCWLLASIFLIEKNEHEFLSYLNMIKKEKEFEMKPFVLSLYYHSKKDVERAMHYYDLYLKSKHNDNDVAIIMNGIFVENTKDERFNEIAKKFNNPAIIKLATEIICPS